MRRRGIPTRYSEGPSAGTSFPAPGCATVRWAWNGAVLGRMSIRVGDAADLVSTDAVPGEGWRRVFDGTDNADRTVTLIHGPTVLRRDVWRCSISSEAVHENAAFYDARSTQL
jgi:hypothetical protein